MRIFTNLKTCITSALLLLSVVTFAQKNFKKEADKKYQAQEYFTAIDLYKEAIAKEKKKDVKAKEVFLIAECYRHINDTKNAETWYAKAVKAAYPDAIAQLYLADMMKFNEKYADAIAEYNKYKTLNPSDKRGENGAKSCELAQKWKDAPTRYHVENMVQINTKMSDFSPQFVDKKFTDVYFTSTREGATGASTDGTTGESYSDIYETKIDKKGKWSTPVLISATINSSVNEGSCYVNHKGNKMYFTRCPIEKKKNMGCEMFYAEKKGSEWDEAKQIIITADSLSVGHPAENVDETILYFASDMPGGFGGRDIWFLTWDKKTKEWSTIPTNAGSTINTDGDEMFPYVHEDGTLYFASNGHIGMGGLDIYKAEKSGDKFTGVTNLRFPINSAEDDFGIVFEGKNERGLFTSNRPGGKGHDDIYGFNLPPLLFAIQGVVTDMDSKTPIAGAKVKLIGSDGTSVETLTDASGAYKFAEKEADRYVKQNVTYTMYASAEKHLNSDKSKVTTVGKEESYTWEQGFGLASVKKVFRLPEILYDLAKWDLKPEFQDSLNGLLLTLNDNPNITVELGSHTDTRGDTKSNAILAQKRAQSVVDYLISKGIAGDRMTAKGYGESTPIITDKQIAALKTPEEKEAAHAKNRRTAFKILRTDYVPHAPTGEAAPTIQDNSGETSAPPAAK